MIILARIAVRVWAIFELVLLTVPVYLLTFLPGITDDREPGSHRFDWYESLFHIWCRTFVRAMGVNINVHQHYATSLPDHHIVIANHPSAFEDIGIPSLFHAHSVAKQGVRDWFLVGRISAAAGTLFVKRDSKESRAATADEIIERLRAGENIAIYPEGGCFGRRINPFLYGIFNASLATGVPIVPVFIHYEAQEDFEWQGQTLPQKMWQILTASNPNANFHIHEPFDPADFPDQETYCGHVHRQYLQWQDKYLL